MARIGRRIYVTHCKGIGFDEDNNMIDIEVDLVGNVSDLQRANWRVRKKLNNQRVTLSSIERTSKYYSMPLETFIDNADSITD